MSLDRSGRPIREGARVPLTRLDGGDEALMEELLAAVSRVARAGAFTLGEEVEAFEASFAAFCGTRHAVGVASGTEALVLALRALEIRPEDEVILPTNSFIATAEAVAIVGATPRFVDVDPWTGLMTRETVLAAVGPRTRVIIPVHLYGRTVDLEPILSLARSQHLRVIEDACQTHGAALNGRRAGALGDLGCFSFYPSKNLGGWGDGGAVVSDDRRLVERIRRMRSHGEVERYRHEVVGTTGRLDGLQAAVLSIKLARLEAANAARRRIGAELVAGLADSAVLVPAPVDPVGDHVFHQFVIQCDQRDRLRRHLDAHGIDTAIHYPVPIHQTPAFARLRSRTGRLAVAEGLARRICSLPIFPSMSDSELTRVIHAVRSFDPAVSAFSRARAVGAADPRPGEVFPAGPQAATPPRR